ncbi:MAG TPA: hypothetical protein VEC37_13225 [Bacillota bacterium]|nr:hypothetical protein [Bacillota bacterium]
MHNKLLCVFLMFATIYTAGCGGGGGRSSSTQTQPQYTASNIIDIPLSNGTGQVTLNTNGNVDTLIAIPYNTATMDGTYATTLTINANSQSLSTVPILSKLSSKIKSHDDFKAKIRDQERELVSLLRSKNMLKNTRNNLSSSNPTNVFKDDPNTTLTFNKLLNSTWVTVTATKKYKGTRCLIYLDNNASVSYLSQTYIDELGQAFDSFHDREVNYFGSPNGTLGDIDNNEMVYILLTELEHSSTQWAAGYFHGVHEVPTSEYAKSNQKEMLFITTHKPTGYTDSTWLNTIKGTLAHEFQHLIFFNNRATKYQSNADYNSETWINEGLSMVAEDLAIRGPGYIHNPDLDDRVVAYLENSSNDSLCTWKDTVADYAPAYMFMRYFVDRYTEEKIKNLISTNSLGTNMLTSVASGASFSQLFRDWLAAVVLDRVNYSYTDATLNNSYLYKTLNLSSYSNITFGQLNSGSSISIPDTTGGYIIKTGLSGKQQITISIQGNPNFGLRLITLPASSNLNQKAILL